MTPRQFDYLVKRYREGIKREDRRAGEIIAMLFNANRDSETTPAIDWQDVFLEWKEGPREQTEKEMFEMMQMFTARTNEGLSH